MDSTVVSVVQGRWASRFGGVAEAFAANLRDRGEVGAAFALVLGGETVVDIWGGWQDGARSRPWRRDTLVNVWSSTKGLNATCFAMLVDRGLIAYADPVARYWPEFAAAGKGDVTIAMLLSHQAGLSGFDTPAEMEDLYGGEAAAARLAAQAPLWPPGSGSGYHAITIGILSAALFRRITGRSLRNFIAEEIADRHGLDMAVGLPAKDADRAAEMLAPLTMGSAGIGALTPPQIAALANPSLDPRLPNTAAWRAAELPSANGFTNAAALAGLYARLLPSWPDAGRLASTGTIAQATRWRIEGVDLVLGLHARWAAGFLLNSDALYGPNPDAFGHSGWGGSFAFADPAADVAMAYTMNQMSEGLRGDPRAMALIEAVYASLG
jgi:CubicO group peptidase (beta-lactamase class C family)